MFGKLLFRLEGLKFDNNCSSSPLPERWIGVLDTMGNGIMHEKQIEGNVWPNGVNNDSKSFFKKL